MDQHGCVTCSKRQLGKNNNINQDYKVLQDTQNRQQRTGRQLKTDAKVFSYFTQLWRWRTLADVSVSTTFLNNISYFAVFLSRFLYTLQKISYHRTMFTLYSVLLLVVPSLGNEVYSLQTKLQDAFVTVGTKFTYKLPYGMFDCNVDRLEVSEGSTRSLPRWLSYNSIKQELNGLAASQDVGTHDVLVVALTNSSSGTGRICGIRAFTITVSSEENPSGGTITLSSVAIETPVQINGDGSHFKCTPGSQAAIATVLFSANLFELTGHRRVKVLTAMADHLNTLSNKVALYTADHGHPLLSELDQLSILASGAGDGRFKPGSKSLLTWRLSCGAIRLSNAYFTELETKAKDGSLSEVLGFPVIGWHVTSGVQRSRHRARRAAAATPTPLATSTPPIRVTSSTTVVISSSISQSSVSSNSTFIPMTSVYITPSSVLVKSTEPASNLSSSISISSTSSVTMNISSAPALPSINFTSTPVLLSTNFTSTSVLPSVNFTSASVSPSANFTSASVLPSTNFTSASVLPSTNFTSASVLPSVNFTSASVLPSVNFTSASVLPSANVTSTPGLPSMSFTTVIQSVSSTTMTNASIPINSTVVLESMNSLSVPSTHSVMNTTYIAMSSSSPVINASTASLFQNSSAVPPSINTSTTVYQNSTIFVNSTIPLTPSPTILPTENSTIFSSTVAPNTTVFISANSTAVISSSVYNSTAVASSRTLTVNETLSTRMLNSTGVNMSSTVTINQTSSVGPSFQTSSLYLPSSTLYPSMTINVTINETASSSVYIAYPNASSVYSVSPNTSSVFPVSPTSIFSVAPNTSSVFSLSANTSSVYSVSPNTSSVYPVLPTTISASPMNTSVQTSSVTTTNASSMMTLMPSMTVVVTTVNVSSMISPTIMNTSLADGFSTVMLSSSHVSSSAQKVSSSSSSKVMNDSSMVQPSSVVMETQTASNVTMVTTPMLTTRDVFSVISTRMTYLSSTSVVYSTTSQIPENTSSSVLISTLSSNVRNITTMFVLPSSSTLSSSFISSVYPSSTVIITPHINTSMVQWSTARLKSMSTTIAPFTSLTSKPLTSMTNRTSAFAGVSSVSSSYYVPARSSEVTTTLNSSSFAMSLSASTYFKLTSSLATSVSTLAVSISSNSSTLMISTSVSLLTSASSSTPLQIYSSTAITSLLPSSSIIPTTEPKNTGPVLQNDIGRIEAIAGRVFTYKIPEDTFYDKQDGNTRNLSLSLKLLNEGLKDIPENFWLKFNASSQTITGLPMEKDVPVSQNLDQRGVKFHLAAKDSSNATAYDAFEILIASSSSSSYVQALTIILNNDFEEFDNNLSQRLSLIDKISRYYNDSDANNVRVLSYKQGSVIFSWTNDSIPSNECDEGRVDAVAEKVVVGNDVQQEFSDSLLPFKVTNATRTLHGACQTTTTLAPLITAKIVATEPPGLWEEHVIPAIIVAIILIILAILLLLCIRRRRAKPSDPERRTYTKRKPIILDPEMELKPIPGKPLVLDNDSPSHPPSYNSDPSLYKSPYSYYNDDGDFSDEEDYKVTPPKQSPAYETPPPLYVTPEEQEKPSPPPYMLPPVLNYPIYELPMWEESSDV